MDYTSKSTEDKRSRLSLLEKGVTNLEREKNSGNPVEKLELKILEWARCSGSRM